MCHASFGAGNYGMCGRAYDGRFVFAWPNHQIGVMGGDQAASTLVDVKRAQLARDGKLDDGELARVRDETLAAFTTQMTAYHSTSELWDDGVLDPVDTRDALGIALSVAVNAPPGAPFGEPGYGVFRM
jgi:3-methylcrotonyl-CoA carboxylase beta subunit